MARIAMIRLDGRAIAFALYLQLAGRAYGLNMAFDPAYTRSGLGSEAKLQSLEASASEGIRRVELLGTAAEHKRRFTDRFEPSTRESASSERFEAGPQRTRPSAGSACVGRRSGRRRRKRLYERVPFRRS